MILLSINSREVVSDLSQPGEDRSHTQNDSLFCANGASSLLGARVQVHVEHRLYVLYFERGKFLLGNDALNTFKATEEDDTVFEAGHSFEINEVDDITFVTSSQFQVIWEGTILKHILYRLRHSHLIPPVLPLGREWLRLRHHFPRVELTLREVVLVQFDCDSGAFHNIVVYLAILVNA